MIWTRVDKALNEAVLPCSNEVANDYHRRKFVAPGMTLLVGQGGDVLYHKAFGCRSIDPEVTALDKDMVYDVASLTKALVTTTMAMKFVEQGRLSLDRKLSHVLQSFSSFGKERITVRHLLAHCSGFPAHIAFYKKIAQLSKKESSGDLEGSPLLHSREAIEMVYRDIVRSKTENLPGKVTVYSDVGFIILGSVLEIIGGGLPFRKLAEQNVLNPLRLMSSGFVDLNLLKRGLIESKPEVIVPTARCPWREKIILGEVHDDNAWVMGGAAGHAGLFATARDIHHIASELLHCWRGRGRFVDREVVRMFWTKDSSVEASSWALGWDMPSQYSSSVAKNGGVAPVSSSGRFLSRHAVGHLGFTGCSLWIDPEREIDIILLTNRIHPSTENQAIKQFRPLIHDLVMETLGFNSMGA